MSPETKIVCHWSEVDDVDSTQNLKKSWIWSFAGHNVLESQTEAEPDLSLLALHVVLT